MDALSIGRAATAVGTLLPNSKSDRSKSASNRSGKILFEDKDRCFYQHTTASHRETSGGVRFFFGWGRGDCKVNALKNLMYEELGNEKRIKAETDEYLKLAT